MGYTLGDAARATGLNKTVILKAIRSGKVSGAKDEHGQWRIEPCELHRVYFEQKALPLEARVALNCSIMCNVKGCLNNTVAKGHARKR